MKGAARRASPELLGRLSDIAGNVSRKAGWVRRRPGRAEKPLKLTTIVREIIPGNFSQIVFSPSRPDVRSIARNIGDTKTFPPVPFVLRM